MSVVTPADILQARRGLAGLVWSTPCVRSPWLSDASGHDVYLKLENLQQTGSFKLRGALNKLKRLSLESEPVDLLTVSAGNHGRAVAYGANLFGLRATVIVPRTAPKNKVNAIRQAGVELKLIGDSYDEAEQAARDMARSSGAVFVSPYNDTDIIAGQGTVAIEVLEQVPDLDTIVVPVSGGGLLAGIAVMAKALQPDIRVIGVQAENSPAMFESFRAGQIVTVDETPTLADGIAGNIEPGAITFPLIHQLVDHIVLVPERMLRKGIIELLDHEQLVAEGAGAVAWAALSNRLIPGNPGKVAAILTGRNIDLSHLQELIREYGQEVL